MVTIRARFGASGHIWRLICAGYCDFFAGKKNDMNKTISISITSTTRRHGSGGMFATYSQWLYEYKERITKKRRRRAFNRKNMHPFSAPPSVAVSGIGTSTCDPAFSCRARTIAEMLGIATPTVKVVTNLNAGEAATLGDASA